MKLCNELPNVLKIKNDFKKENQSMSYMFQESQHWQMNHWQKIQPRSDGSNQMNLWQRTRDQTYAVQRMSANGDNRKNHRKFFNSAE